MMQPTADDGDIPANPFSSPDQAQARSPSFAQPPSQNQNQPQAVVVPLQQQQQQPQFTPQFDPPPAQADDFYYDGDKPPPAQTFNPISGVGAGPMDTQMNAQMNSTAVPGYVPGPAPTTWWQKIGACMSLNTYAAFFDIDTIDIINRIKGAVMFFYIPDKFRVEIIGVERNEAANIKGPDLYGPYWLTMTMIFLLAVTSNAHAYLHSDSEEEFEYDISHLIRATAVLVPFAFVLPVTNWLLTQFLSMNVLGLADWVCIYGYSLVPFIPATILCLIPVGFLDWIWLFIAFAISVVLVLRNVAGTLMASDTATQQHKSGPILISILVWHILLFCILKYFFYNH